MTLSGHEDDDSDAGHCAGDSHARPFTEGGSHPATLIASTLSYCHAPSLTPHRTTHPTSSHHRLIGSVMAFCCPLLFDHAHASVGSQFPPCETRYQHQPYIASYSLACLYALSLRTKTPPRVLVRTASLPRLSCLYTPHAVTVIAQSIILAGTCSKRNLLSQAPPHYHLIMRPKWRYLPAVGLCSLRHEGASE